MTFGMLLVADRVFHWHYSQSCQSSSSQAVVFVRSARSMQMQTALQGGWKYSRVFSILWAGQKYSRVFSILWAGQKCSRVFSILWAGQKRSRVFSILWAGQKRSLRVLRNLQARLNR
jgi:hypothetical protein